MNNNDILVRLRYALDIKDTEMVKIFKLGGMDVTRDEVQNLLKNNKNEIETNTEEEKESFSANTYKQICDDHTLETFLNGFIIANRGQQKDKDGQPKKPEFMIHDHKHVNNVLLKKVKIALSLTSEDLLDILQDAGVYLSNSELSAVLRKEGQRNYKECGDRYARNFLKGLALRYRS